MNLSPNTLNLHSYNISPQHQQSANSPQSFNNTQPNTFSLTIQQKFDQFVRDIRHHQDLINDMVQNISHITQFKQDPNAQQNQRNILAFYPRLWLESKYFDDEEKQVVAYSNKEFNSILRNLQKNNAKLKQQLKGYFFEYSKQTLLTQNLISHNKDLRKFVIKANTNLKSLLEHLRESSKYDNPELINLNLQLNQLKQQNGILCDHQKKLKQKLKQKQQEQEQLAQALDDKMKYLINIESQMKDMDDEEQNLGNDLVLQSQSKQELGLRQKYLLKEKQRLLLLKQEYGKDRSQIECSSTGCQTSMNEFEVRIQPMLQNYRVQHDRTIEQAQTLYQQYENQQESLKQTEYLIQKNKQKLSQYTIQSTKLNKKQQLYQSQLQKSQKQKEQVFDIQKQLKSKYDILDVEIKQLQQTIQNKKNIFDVESNKDKINIKNLQKLKMEEIQRWRRQLEISRTSSNKRMIGQSHGIQMQKVEIQGVSRQIGEMNAYVQYLLDQIRERRQKEDIANQMRHKIYSQTQFMSPLQSTQPFESPQQTTHFYPIQNHPSPYFPINPESPRPTHTPLDRPQQRKGIQIQQVKSNPHKTHTKLEQQRMESPRGRLPIQLKGNSRIYKSP